MEVEHVLPPQTAGPSAVLEDRIPTLRLQATTGWGSLGLRELWAHRELVYFFVWRDLKVRYKQTALGASWAILQPLATMVVFSLFFGRLARMPSDGIPYPLFSYAALVPWMFFVNALTQGSNSLVANGHLLTKVYFPRLALPISSLVAGGVDFLLSFLGLLGLMAYFGFPLTLKVLFLPAFILLLLVTSLGVALWLAAVNVQFRDVRHTVPFLTQFWMFATPIAYPSSLLPEPWRTVYGLNPMAGVVEGFRWALLGVNTVPGAMVFVSAAVAVALVVTGAIYFRRMERTFADVV
jgi:lipopolysaccharide transport system permease protein